MVYALIYQTATKGAAMWDIAGQPLLVRQLQWLRDRQITNVIVEVCCAGIDSGALSRWLFSSDPLLDGVRVVPSATPLGPRGLALRAGLATSQLTLTLANDTLVSCELPTPLHPLRYQLRAPTTLGPRLEIAIEPLDGQPEPAEPQAGWAARLSSEADAHALSCTVLAGNLNGVLMHAFEHTPGVWLARGAYVAPDAEVRAPALIGPEARIHSRAVVGPRVVVGARAVIERKAQLSDCVVDPQTLVGEQFCAHGARLTATGTVSLHGGTHTPAGDTYQLTTRPRTDTTLRYAQAGAFALLLVLFAPWLMAALLALPFRAPVRRAICRRNRVLLGTLGIAWLDVVPRLLDVLRGARTLLGPGDLELLDQLPEDVRVLPGAFDVLSPFAARAHRDRALRLLRWYAHNKASSLDWQLWIERTR